MKQLEYPRDFDRIKSVVEVSEHNEEVANRVRDIVKDVRNRKEDALLELTRKFDQVELSKENIKLRPEELEVSDIPDDFKEAVAVAIQNITDFHKKQLPSELEMTGKYGEKLGQRFTAMDRVGVYVPGGAGGTTPLVSTLMMNIIPAQIAGCKEIVAVTPPRKDGSIHPYLCYTFNKLGVDQVYKIGGAQAVAALAYGTETIDPVDIIVGPGNSYVTAAKKEVFGQVMIDGLFGHSEIVVISDGSVSPDHIACDLLSQAEHAGGELVVLISDDQVHADAVKEAMVQHQGKLERQQEIKSSVDNRGLVIMVDDLKNTDKVAELVNYIAPEHLELLVENYQELVKKIKHTGAIFLGGLASEPIGDYICGTNHVLPTGRSARFTSPLGVYTFLKRTNLISYNKESFNQYARHAEVLARAEGLTAHAKALTVRY